MIRFKLLDSTVHMRVSDASTINGKDGVTPHIGDNGNWYLGDVDTGNPSRGETGPAGYTPVRGTDYWTAADQNAIVSQAVTQIQPDISELKSDIANTESRLSESIDEIRNIYPPSPQLINRDEFQKDKRPAIPAGSDINDIVSENNYTLFNPIIYLEENNKTLATNLPSGFTFLGYYRNGENLLRSEFVTIDSFTTIGNHKEYTFNGIIEAVRVYGGTVQLMNMNTPPIITFADKWDDTATEYNTHDTVELRNDVKTPRLDGEVKRLDSRIDDIQVSGDIPFLGKKIVGIGDSIMVGINANGTAIVDGKNADGTPCTDQGYQINSTGGFLGELRARYGDSITVVNMGVGSTTMQKNDSIEVNAVYRCIADRVDSIPSDADIIILEGGLNDYFHANKGCTLGTYENHLYKYPVSAKYENGGYSFVEWATDVHLDINSFCGAFEIALTKILVRFIGIPFIYVIPHNPSGVKEIDDFFNSAKAICKKYGVPVVDIREVGCMPRIYALCGKEDGSSAFTYDTVHPNPLGYQKHYVPQIASMLKSIM